MNHRLLTTKYKKLLIISITISIFIIILIIYNSNPINSYIKSLETNNITKADKIYYSKIATNQKLQNILSEKITLKGEKIYNMFYQNDISYEKAISKLNLLHNSNIGTIQIANIRDKLNQLNTSKTAYARAF